MMTIPMYVIRNLRDDKIAVDISRLRSLESLNEDVRLIGISCLKQEIAAAMLVGKKSHYLYIIYNNHKLINDAMSREKERRK